MVACTLLDCTLVPDQAKDSSLCKCRPSFRLEGGPLTVQSMQTVGGYLQARPDCGVCSVSRSGAHNLHFCRLWGPS